MPTSFFDPHPDYQKRLQAWELARDLLGGTAAIRAAARRYLPAYPEEDPLSYESRVQRLFVFGAFRDAIERIVSKPFSRPMLVEGLPDVLQYAKADFDRRGGSLEAHQRAKLEHIVAYGVALSRVAFPDTRPFESARGTVAIADIRAHRLRPYCRLVHPVSLIWWDHDDASPFFAEARILDSRYEDVAGKLEVVEIVHRLLPGAWEIHERRGGRDGSEVLASQGQTNLSFVPLIPTYASAGAENPMLAPGPIDDLAWMNLEHIQSKTEQRGALSFARASMILDTGCPDDDVKKPLVWGQGKAIRRTAGPDDTDIRVIEPTGVGIEHGAKDLETIERRMEARGAQPLMRGARTTATDRNHDEGKALCLAQLWVKDVERSAATELRVMDLMLSAQGGGVADLDERLPDLVVDVFSDFGIDGDSGRAAYALVQKDHEDGVISDEERLRAAKRFDIYPETLDIDETLESARTQAQERALQQAKMFAETAVTDGKPAPEAQA